MEANYTLELTQEELKKLEEHPMSLGKAIMLFFLASMGCFALAITSLMYAATVHGDVPNFGMISFGTSGIFFGLTCLVLAAIDVIREH